MRCTAQVLASMLATVTVAHAEVRRPRAIAAATTGAESVGERVTIAHLIAAAVQRSPGLTIARAEHDEARGRGSAAGAVDEWQVFARIDGRDTIVDRELAGPSVSIDTRLVNGEVGLGRSVWTGGNLTVAATTGQVHHVYPRLAAGGQPSVEDIEVGGVTAGVRVEASQPLLRGAGRSVARADQKMARLAARVLSAQADDDAASVVRDLVVAYWELTYAAQALAVDRDGEALAQRQLAITRDAVRLGVQPPSAVKTAELQVALHREAILRDEMAIVDRSLAVRRLAGLELTSTPLVPDDELHLPEDRWSEDAVVASTLASGPSVLRRRLAHSEAGVALDVARDAMWPRLDVKLSGEIGGRGSTTIEAFGRLGEVPAYSVMASLSLQWEIGGAARAAARAARARRVRLDAERADLERQLSASAMSAVQQLRLAMRRIEVTELAVKVAEEVLRAEVVAFQGGRSTNVLVFQRQEDVAQARLRLARAHVDALQASTQLEYLTGELLRRYGVTVDTARSGS